jgi:1,2-phenylacetyl-CoA epoxidase catalytic subunit
MRFRLQAILERITADPALEGRWLNTLSLLEFIGARKIGRTVASHHPTLEVLGHLADETRHAAAFKRLARDVSGDESASYLCEEDAKAYFQRLDRELAAWAAGVFGREDVQLNYLLTTTVVERRAMLLYPIYKAVTRQAAVRAELGKVIVEEQSHRREIEGQCRRLLEGANAADLSAPQAIDDRLFGELLRALEREVAA